MAADWSAFARSVAQLLVNDPEVTLSIDEIIARTGSSNRSLRTRSFWSSIQRGDASKAFLEAGILVEPLPRQRGKEIQTISFRLARVGTAPTSKIVVVQSPECCRVMTEAAYQKLATRYPLLETRAVSGLVARVVHALGEGKRFPDLNAAQQWVTTLCGKDDAPSREDDAG